MESGRVAPGSADGEVESGMRLRVIYLSQKTRFKTLRKGIEDGDEKIEKTFGALFDRQASGSFVVG